jgi:glycosyltransferase involved in cell wall biosynthesis
MRVLQVLTYYRPHTSGLTIYVERLSRALAAQGHEVTVLTSQYERTLPRVELGSGVRVIRVPVAARLSKGVLMPGFGLAATREVRQHQVVHLHLPQFDAAGVALRGRLLGRPTVITYHCDLTLPRGAFNRVVNAVVHVMNHAAAALADRIVTYTRDYADSSPYLNRHRQKLDIILPPVELPRASDAAVRSCAERFNPEQHRPVIGMATRLAAEKGVEVLLEALPMVTRSHPDATVLFAGQHRDVLGEERYRQRLAAAIEPLRAAGRWRFVGVLDQAEMAAFYAHLDVLVVPSLNATESFGLVQIEAMMHGVPVVSSNLPGVRQPVQLTGMGRVARVGSADSLAEELLEVLNRPERYRGDPAEVASRFTPAVTASAYVDLYRRLRGGRASRPAHRR